MCSQIIKPRERENVGQNESRNTAENRAGKKYRDGVHIVSRPGQSGRAFLGGAVPMAATAGGPMGSLSPLRTSCAVVDLHNSGDSSGGELA